MRFDVVFDSNIDYSKLLSKILLVQANREKIKRISKEIQKEVFEDG